MELHITLIAPGAGRVPSPREELVARLPRGTRGAQLAEVIEHAYGVRGITVAGKPVEGLTVGEPPLRGGAILMGGSASPELPAADHGSGLLLAIRSGPAAGRLIPLARGIHRLGRSDCEGPRPVELIGVPDPELSRIHAELRITDTSVRLVDRGSSNGTWIGAERISEAELEAGRLFRVGATVCSIEFGGEGHLDARAGCHHGEPLRITRHRSPQRTTTLLAAVLLPLALGVGLALFTGQWMFLAFSSMSLVSLLLPLAEGRRERRRFREQLAEAVAQDLERRNAAAPDAAGVCLAVHTGISRHRENEPASPETVYLRLGSAPLAADVAVEPPGDVIPHHGQAPLVIAAKGTIAVRGPTAAVSGLVRFLLLQLAALPAAAGRQVLLVGGADDLRLAARFVPRIRVLTGRESAESHFRNAMSPSASQTVVVLPPGASAEGVRGVIETTVAEGGCVIDAAGAFDAHESQIDLGSAPVHAASRALGKELVPDLLEPATFEKACRALGTSSGREEDRRIPQLFGLGELVGMTRDEMVLAWSSDGRGGGCSLPIGVGKDGPLSLDLVEDGPHVLIAGTTGAGKSELLRTMIAGGATLHPPERLAFLFIDFKGGAGLALLEPLPHCVGTVTDLSGGLNRVLISLRAELLRREFLLASAGCDDVRRYPTAGGREPLPRLVVVVDEFRVLVEEEPESLRELLRIASVGRSLGIHLIMATQRPQGAISNDIRANIGSSIALRVVGDAESRDVIGSNLSANIPASLPGRGYLARPGQETIEFQAASLSLTHEGKLHSGPRLERAIDWLHRAVPAHHRSDPGPADRAADIFVREVKDVWNAAGGWLPRPPVAEPLPEDAGPALAGGHRVLLGIADLPHEQRLCALHWSPEDHGHLALVASGAKVSGPVLASIAQQLGDSSQSRHLYVLDSDGCASALEHQERTGAYVALDDPVRAARVVTRLTHQASRGCSNVSPTPPGQPTRVLIISGWGRWLSAFRQAQCGTEGQLHDLVRAGSSTGLVVLVTGEGDLVSSRVFAEFGCRIFLPHGVPEDARLGWPRLPAAPTQRFRALATGFVGGGGPVVVQCHAHESDIESRRATRGGTPRPFTPTIDDAVPPLRIRPLPESVAALDLARASESAGGPGRQARRLVVGVHGDDVEPLAIPVQPGELLLVLGRTGTGKTSFVDALPAMNPSEGPWYAVPSRSSGDHAASVDLTDALNETMAAARRGTEPLLLVDDLDRLTAGQLERVWASLDSGASVIATADSSSSRLGRPAAVGGIRSTDLGIVIGSRSPADGGAFGVRLTASERHRPGRAVAVIHGRQVEVQLGWLGPAENADGNGARRPRRALIGREDSRAQGAA